MWYSLYEVACVRKRAVTQNHVTAGYENEQPLSVAPRVLELWQCEIHIKAQAPTSFTYQMQD
jgi:hypothetical protein